MKKSIIVISCILLLLVTVGTTLALVFTNTDPVENTFKPSKVSCAVVENGEESAVENSTVNTGTVKENVMIKNTGDTDAFIRVAVVVNWMSADGTKVWAQKPAINTDYSIAFKQDDWVQGADGYWYCKKAVASGSLTDTLITSAQQKKAAPEGYYLSIEIVASAIQSSPDDVVGKQWSNDHTTVTGSNGTLTITNK